MPDYIHTDGRTLKLGAGPPKQDRRSIMLSRILRELPPAPTDWDSRLALMQKYSLASWYDSDDGNLKVGDCVIAARAKAQRLQLVQQTGKMPDITTNEVLTEYLAETGGSDTGLYESDADKLWRTKGWTAGGERRTIGAYAAVDWGNADELKVAIYYLLSVHLTLALPQSAQAQVGSLWTVTPGQNDSPGSWGYHEVNAPKYQSDGTWVCQTWGGDQPMTTEFLLKYCTEAKCFVPSIDTLDPVTTPINMNALLLLLAKVSDIPDEPVISSISPVAGNQGDTLAVTLNGQGFKYDSDVSFGETIEVSNWTAASYNQGQVTIVIGATAAPGKRAVTMNTGIGAIGILEDAFEVVGTAPVPPIPPEPPQPVPVPPPPAPVPEPPKPGCLLGPAAAVLQKIRLRKKKKGVIDV